MKMDTKPEKIEKTEKKMEKPTNKQINPKMKNGIKIMWMTFMLCFAALPIFATEIIINKDETVTSIGVDETEDQILVGENTTFSGKAGDVLMFGKTLNVEGLVSFSAILIGDTVNVSKDIGNDLYAGGKFVNITGNIGDNAYLAGQNIVIGPDTIINGTVIAMGKDLKISGDVYGDIYAGVGFLTIDGTIHGNIYAEVERIAITERGNVKGDLTYSAERELSDKDLKQIKGTVAVKDGSLFACHRNSSKFGNKSMHRRTRENHFGFSLFPKLFFLFGILFSGLLILLFPVFSNVYKEKRESSRFWQSLLWGLIPLFIYPVAAGVSMIILPLGIAMVLIALPVIGITVILGLTLLGQFLFKTFKWKSNSRHLHFLFACAVFSILLIIPVISNLTVLALSALGWGVIMELLFIKKFGTKDAAAGKIEDNTSSKE